MWNPEQRSPVILLVATHWTMRMAVREPREQARVPVLWPLLTDCRSAHHGIVRPGILLLSLIHMAPRGAAPLRDLTRGSSWLGQGWARNPIRANRSYLWESELDIKQEESLFLCVPCSLRKTVYRGRGKTDASSKVLRPERRSVTNPAAFLALVCGTPCVASF